MLKTLFCQELEPWAVADIKTFERDEVLKTRGILPSSLVKYWSLEQSLISNVSREVRC